MKAVIAKTTGGPEVLKPYELPEPELLEGEIKIRVRAFGLNKAEMYNMKGGHGPFSGELALGIEAAGEVIEDPTGELAQGQKVITAMGGMMFSRHGSYASVICVKRTNVQAIHSDISFEQLATLPQAYLTAWGAVDHALQLNKDETLLVRGATSSIGLAAVVYAKFKGARVIATTRSESHKQRLIDIGADLVLIDNGNIEEQVKASPFTVVDKAIELVGTSTLKDTMSCIRRWGEVAFVGFLGGTPVFDKFHMMNDLPNTVKLSFFGSGILGSDELVVDNSPIPELAELLHTGKLPDIHAQTFNINDIQAAHQLLGNNTALGKVVVLHD